MLLCMSPPRKYSGCRADVWRKARAELAAGHVVVVKMASGSIRTLVPYGGNIVRISASYGPEEPRKPPSPLRVDRAPL
jgi:hypothetical protein